MPYWACSGVGPGFWWVFPLLFAGLWLLFFGFLIWRFGWWGRRGWGGQGWGPDAEAVLRERFARGEIDADEYHKRRGVLEGQR